MRSTLCYPSLPQAFSEISNGLRLPFVDSARLGGRIDGRSRAVRWNGQAAGVNQTRPPPCFWRAPADHLLRFRGWPPNLPGWLARDKIDGYMPMRRLPPWIWLALAAVSGITASIVWMMHQSVQPVLVKAPTVAALTVKREIAPATRLGADLLATAVWSQENLPTGAFTSAAEVEGRVTAFPMAEGELILEKKLAPKGTVPGLTALLSPNMRAMTVKVDEASGVAGFVAPENRVDVLITVDKGEYSKAPLSRVLLQNLRVLGTGQRTENRPGDKPQVVPTVTLEVSPVEGERLALAAQTGRISLVLRGQDDKQLVLTQGVSAGNLFGPPPPVAPAVADPKQPAPPRRISEIIRGLQRQPVNF